MTLPPGDHPPGSDPEQDPAKPRGNSDGPTGGGEDLPEDADQTMPGGAAPAGNRSTGEGGDAGGGDPGDLDQTLAGPTGSDAPAEDQQDRAKAGADGDATRQSDTQGMPPVTGKAHSLKLTPAESALIGTQLGGCQIHQLLGRGAMGSVFRATQVHLDREVAVKTIRPDMLLNESVLKRFRSEGLSQSRFTSPFVVPVYEAGEQDGTFYLVMRYVSGGTLTDYTRSKPRKRLPEDEALRFLLQCVEGLKEAQVHSVLHRDIKPDNILLDEQGRAMLSDFGIAKILDSGINLTQSMDHVGTPLYMSPEQCRGEDLDFRTDMYSLGATFFYLVTNLPPARGSSILELIQTKTSVQYLSPAQALPEFENSTPLSRVIERMTALERSDRYGSWDELEDQLRDAMKGIQPPKPPRSRRAAASSAAHPAVAEPTGGRGKGLLVGLLVVVLAGAGLAWQQGWLGAEPEGEPIAEDTPPKQSDVDEPGVDGPPPVGPGPVADGPKPPGPGEPDDADADTDGPTGDDPGSDDPKGPGHNGPDNQEPGTTVIGTGVPGVIKPDVDGPGVDGPGLDGPGSAAPQADEPGMGEPDPDNKPVLPGAGTEDYDEAVANLAQYRTAFRDQLPDEALLSTVDDFAQRGYRGLDRDRADVEALRAGYVQLHRRVEAALKSIELFRAMPQLYDPVAPFNDLQAHLDRCVEYCDALRDPESGALYGWAEPVVRSRISGTQFQQALANLRSGIRSIQSRLRNGFGDLTTSDVLDQQGRLRTLEDGIERLERMAASPRLPIALAPGWEEELQQERLLLQGLGEQLSGLGELVAKQGALTEIGNELEGYQTLSAWRSQQPDGGASLARSLEERVGAEPPVELVQPYRAVRDKLERWRRWDERMQAVARRLTDRQPLGEVADWLQEQNREDRLDGYYDTPPELTGLAVGLTELSTAFQQLGRDADVPAAKQRFETATGGERVAALRLLGPAAAPIEQAGEALEQLVQQTSGMVSVPPGEVAMQWQEGGRGARRQRSETVSAFLVQPTEVTNREWLEFLRASQADSWEALPERMRRIWSTEGIWSRACSVISRLEQTCRTEPDHPIEQVSLREAQAYASWRGLSLPSLAQWWRVARGVRGKETAFPWGNKGAGRDPMPRDPAKYNYIEDSVPVQQGGIAASSRELGQDIHHLAGNVAEWLAGPEAGRGRFVGGSYTTNRLRRPDQVAGEYSGEVLGIQDVADHRMVVGIRLYCDPRATLQAAGLWLD